jgi:hypothetical protein
MFRVIKDTQPRLDKITARREGRVRMDELGLSGEESIG